jgi:hypothetical protein
MVHMAAGQYNLGLSWVIAALTHGTNAAANREKHSRGAVMRQLQQQQ